MGRTESQVDKKKVFPIDKSYLCFTLNVLSCLGIWNPSMEKGRKYWLYQAYTMYYVIVIMLLRILTILVRAINASNSTEFSQEISLLAVLICDAIKSFTIIVHRPELLTILGIFNWERKILATDQIKYYRNRVITTAMLATKIFTIAVAIFLTNYFLFYFYVIWKYSDYEIKKLPIGSPPLKYCFILTNYWVAISIDFVIFTALGLSAVCHDAFIMGVMIHVMGQLKILNFRVERSSMTSLIKTSDDEVEENSKVIQFECVERESNESVRLDPNEELINCIRHHQQILKILEIFRKVYNVLLLPQLSVSLILITISGLQMILVKDGGNLDGTLVALVFCITAVIQLFAFCWGGNIILVESDKTSFAIYSAQWYDRDIVYRNNIKIFLSLVRNPLIVSAGGLFDLSAVTFKNILTKAYSGVAVLQNVQD
ncbi:odorant receptor 22c [Fopius arisanus]|uniref:Odorant receptor n=2 Tax=Fopius arisanus TaxID=64838 RepID=A0A0C9QZR4_9HYME|nr:PREDICTED: odorant receptor 22c-like [Fopius arisanus]